jgi:hypothetical protein
LFLQLQFDGQFRVTLSKHLQLLQQQVELLELRLDYDFHSGHFFFDDGSQAQLVNDNCSQFLEVCFQFILGLIIRSSSGKPFSPLYLLL